MSYYRSQFKEGGSKSFKSGSKSEYLLAKKGRTYITPKNREYQEEWSKVGNKWRVVLKYKDLTMTLTEFDYNSHTIDEFIDIMIRDSKIK